MTTHPHMRVCDYAEYGDGRAGWVIEAIHGWSADDLPIYALPDWNERSLPELARPFDNRAAAESALQEYIAHG